MKYNNLLLLTVLLLGTTPSIANDCFKLADDKGGLKTTVKIFSTSKSMSLPFHPDRTAIGGLAITGSVKKYSNDFLVRIVLLDKERHERLIMESYNSMSEGNEFSFNNYCEETALLDAVYPDTIKIYVRNAIVTINGIQYREALSKVQDIKAFGRRYDQIRNKQLTEKVNRINNFNRINNKLWCAGITTLAEKCYEDKKRLLGIKDDESTDGIEYYAGGIFEAGMSDNNNPNKSSSMCVDQFDWRNRHSQNWMTSVKHQGNSSFCYSFCAVGAIEALLNLYCNSHTNLDLSEDEGARCPYYDDRYYLGGFAVDVLDYAKNSGICDELAIPFIDSCCISCQRDTATPHEIVKIEDYTYIGNTSEDSIKKALINKGPLTSGYKGHAMVLVGYGTIKQGDVISVHDGGVVRRNVVIGAGDSRIGKTYWIFKNSYGTNAYGNINGYWYIMFNQLDRMREPYAVIKPYCTINTFMNHVVCEDKDGDGYYFWGLGPKPDSCPSWVPDEPDGDDSNIECGPMNEYGFLDDLSCGTTINTSVEHNDVQTLSCSLGIVNGGTLTIRGTTTLAGNARIRVCEGGVLIVDGGTINNAKIDFVPGSSLFVRNNGTINKAIGESMNVPLGVNVDIDSGTIN